MKPEPQEEQKFFEYGEVTFAERDFQSRQVVLHMTMPNCLFQAITPSLLGSGFVDGFQVRNPIAVWIPKLLDNSFNNFASGVDAPEQKVNLTLKTRAEEILRIWEGISQFLRNPSDIIPFLPMGTYVTLRHRVRIDDIPKLLEGVNSTPVIGIPEFQYALACVLACVLEDFERWERPRLQS